MDTLDDIEVTIATSKGIFFKEWLSFEECDKFRDEFTLADLDYTDPEDAPEGVGPNDKLKIVVC